MDVKEKLIDLLMGHSIDTQQDVEYVADHLISNGVTVQEWISVDDRLPESFESVLVSRDGKITIDHHEENGWFAYDFNGKRATHWMPIPKPPKGE